MILYFGQASPNQVSGASYTEEVKKIVYEVVPEDFRAIRDEAGLTQAAFAESLGVTKGMIAQVESGAALPSLRLLFDMCELCNIRFDLGPKKHPLLKPLPTPAAISE